MQSLICPICSQGLLENVHGISCVNRHQFDRAKEGYFNLLPVHFKNSLAPGDSKEQLAARRQFLSAGYFSQVAQTLIELMPKNALSILDIGCGEGYFTRAISDAFPSAAVYGIDIAKAGIRLAAKLSKQKICYSVASSYSLPLADESMDVITRIYAPSKDEELLRVLKPSGKLIIISPGQDHMINLRRKIYQEIRPLQLPSSPQGFSLIEHHTLNYEVCISAGEMTSAFLMMTPFAWKIRPELKADLVAVGIKEQLNFDVNVYEKQ